MTYHINADESELFDMGFHQDQDNLLEPDPEGFDREILPRDFVACEYCKQDVNPKNGHSVQELVHPDTDETGSLSVLAHLGVCTDTLILSGKWELL